MPETSSPRPRSDRQPLTREQVLEHALRALIHAAPDDVVADAIYLCTDHPGHSVLAARAADEIDHWKGADSAEFDSAAFAAALPRPKGEDRG